MSSSCAALPRSACSTAAARTGRLRIPDLRGGDAQQRQLLAQQVRELDVVMGGQCADRDLAILLADVVEAVDPADVDEERGCRQAQFHQRDQAVAAGEDLGLLPVFDQLGDRLRHGARNDVIEGGWNHRPVPPLRCISCQTFSGVAGIVMSLTPNGASASTTALITAALDAIVPASPTPLVPSGLTGLGVTVAASSNVGRSAAVGTR